jgi:hypothetical protein
LVRLLLHDCASAPLKSEPAESLAAAELGLGWTNNLNNAPSARGMFLGSPGDLNAFLEFSDALQPLSGWFTEFNTSGDLSSLLNKPVSAYANFRKGFATNRSFEPTSGAEMGIDWWTELRGFDRSRVGLKTSYMRGQRPRRAFQWLGLGRLLSEGELLETEGLRSLGFGATVAPASFLWTLRSDLNSSAFERRGLEWRNELGVGFQKKATSLRGLSEGLLTLGYRSAVFGSSVEEGRFATLALAIRGKTEERGFFPLAWTVSAARQLEWDVKPYSPELLGNRRKSRAIWAYRLNLESGQAVGIDLLSDITPTFIPGLSVEYVKTSSGVTLFETTRFEAKIYLKSEF